MNKMVLMLSVMLVISSIALIVKSYEHYQTNVLFSDCLNSNTGGRE